MVSGPGYTQELFGELWFGDLRSDVVGTVDVGLERGGQAHGSHSLLLSPTGSFSEASFAYTPAGKPSLPAWGSGPQYGAFSHWFSPSSSPVSFPHSEGLSGASSR